MCSYSESIEYLKKVAHLEKNKNPETFSDMARCIYEIRDEKRMETEGMELIDKALAIDSNCANAWLNKGNLE